MMRVLQPIQVDINFHLFNGEILKVKFDIAGVEIRRVRVSTLPPEVTETQITNVMSNYGDVKKIQDEVWSQAYRFKVKSGVTIIDI
jgi:RNA recognition motif-containing protein